MQKTVGRKIYVQMKRTFRRMRRVAKSVIMCLKAICNQTAAQQQVFTSLDDWHKVWLLTEFLGTSFIQRKQKRPENTAIWRLIYYSRTLSQASPWNLAYRKIL